MEAAAGLVIMKEIDFLPEWYKSGRRRQISYRTQYVALGGVFVVMLVWNFIASHSISKARGELTQMAPKQTEAESVSREFAKIKSQVTRLQKKAKILDEIDSKIDVASVLAEMSFLIDEKIVLSKVDFRAEGFVDKQGGKASGYRGSAVRVARGNFAGKQTQQLGDVRFKIVVNGVASDASDVAELICKLEDSPYFCLVYPSFSRSKKMKVGKSLTGKDFQATEFEIACYLANYNELTIGG
jgi:Tfp pilus assembly protein PilN